MVAVPYRHRFCPSIQGGNDIRTEGAPFFNRSFPWILRPRSLPSFPRISPATSQLLLFNMASRTPITSLYRRSNPLTCQLSQRRVSTQFYNVFYRNPKQSRGMATVVPSIAQSDRSSKGPTAIVFMNMGGPSTTDEVGDFLSRLFVGVSDYFRVMNGTHTII